MKGALVTFGSLRFNIVGIIFSSSSGNPICSSRDSYNPSFFLVISVEMGVRGKYFLRGPLVMPAEAIRSFIGYCGPLEDLGLSFRLISALSLTTLSSLLHTCQLLANQQPLFHLLSRLWNPWPRQDPLSISTPLKLKFLPHTLSPNHTSTPSTSNRNQRLVGL